MKKSTGKPENDPLHQKAEGLLKNSMENDSPQGNDEFAGFNETLLLSLPYPAMYVRRRDRVIVAANKIAIELGARIGRHCWREFGKSNHISPEDRETALNYPDLVPPELHIKCSFCRGDDCFSDSPNQNNPELHAFGRIWDSYWIKASEDVFLHYLIDITEHKQLVDSLRKSEIYLKQTQQIARLGTYTHDITTGIWVCSEILNQIFGIDAGYTKTVESWASIIHPDWRQRMTDYFTNEVVGNKKRFDKEYKIIRQNDGAERWVHGLGDLQFDDQNQPVQMIGTIRDITERKQKEEERKFLIAAVENTDSIIAVKDLDLRIVAANQAFANACGFTSIESLIGKTDAEVYGIPPQSEPVRTYMEDERKAQQLKPGEYILREEPLILPDGKTITILTRKYPIYDSEGNLFCTGSVSTNITERKEADKALWLKNIIFDTSIAANSIAGLDWKVTDANEAFLHDMGYQHKEEVIGKPVSHFLLHGFEADALTTALEDTGQWEGNFTAKRGDGSTFMAHALTTVLQDKNGKKTGYQASIIDITDLKETEEALREKEQMLQTVLDHFPGVVFWKDRESKYLGCNQAFASGVGLSNPAEIVGKTDFDLPWSETGAENYRAVDSEVMESGQKKLHIVERKNLLDGDGKLIWFDTSKIPLREPGGRVMGMMGVSIDITDLKQAEEALRKNEQMLLTVLDHFPGVVFWKDKQSVYLGCNEAFAKGAGLNSRTEIIGKSDFDLPWGGTEAINYRTDDQEVMEKGKIKLHIIETQHQADGKVTWFDTSKVPLREPSGQVIGVIGVSNDITVRKLAEDALTESEEKYRTVADYTDDWEYWIDPNDNFLYCSPSCERITGYKATEFIQNPELLFRIIYPLDQKIFQVHKQEGFVHSENDELQFRIVRLDGAIRWIGHVCQPVYNESGNCMGFRGSNRDITERKKTEQKLKNSEQKYKLLSENITDGVFISRDGSLEYANKAMSQIFGYDAAELDGFQLTRLIATDHQPDFKIFISVESISDQVSNLETECFKKDHTSVFVEFYLHYVANEGVVYGVVHDITLKKQIQERNIVKAIIQTEEKERVSFSRELHEGLGPLLSIIKLNLQFSVRHPSDESRKDIILKTGNILEEAITTVREISSKLSPHLLTNYGLTSAVQSFVHKLEDTHTLKINFQSNITHRIEMEVEVALYRAIIECVNNTIKYADAQHILIKLDYATDRINLQYRDDGRGYDMEKVLSGRKGLGLFNLQSRIQSIGGEIKLFSKPGEGVYYQISVPVK